MFFKKNKLNYLLFYQSVANRKNTDKLDLDEKFCDENECVNLNPFIICIDVNEGMLQI